jgi:hypothetical protein
MARKKSSGAPATASCVLYDPADGSIVHTHTVVRFDRGSVPSPRELETEARASLAKQPNHRDGLQVLHVKTDDLMPEGEFKVHPTAGTLEKLPERRRPGKRGSPAV